MLVHAKLAYQVKNIYKQRWQATYSSREGGTTPSLEKINYKMDPLSLRAVLIIANRELIIKVRTWR